MDISSRQNTNKETLDIGYPLEQMDLTDIYRTFHPVTKGYTFFSSTHGIFSRINHILCHKRNLNKFKKIEIISCLL